MILKVNTCTKGGSDAGSVFTHCINKMHICYHCSSSGPAGVAVKV